VTRARRRSRSEHLDLLPTTAEAGLETWSTALIVDPRAQLRQITDLARRGLISPAEFERQRRKVADG
jgi:hypothetical protein